MVGPIAATLNAEPFQFYTGGILNPKSCGNTYFDLSHAIVLVGYGTENNIDYWIIKNSWGEKWGEKGYVRLFRGNNVCGIAIDNFTAILK